MSVCLCLCVCLSVSMSVCPCLSVCMYVSVCLSVSVSVCVYLCLSACVCLSLSVPICLSVSLALALPPTSVLPHSSFSDLRLSAAGFEVETIGKRVRNVSQSHPAAITNGIGGGDGAGQDTELAS